MSTPDKGNDTEQGPEYHFVQSLARGLAVIDCFSAANPKLTLSEVSRMTGINRAASRRLLLTLVQLGYVRSEGNRFSLTPKVLNLGYAYLSVLSVPDVAMPHLRNLATAVGESAYLSILDGLETVCIAYFPVRRIWSMTITVGTRLPAATTAAGRVLLADLNQEWLQEFVSVNTSAQFTSHTITNREELMSELRAIRQQGWAFVDQELEEGIRVLAAPIRDPRDGLAAAVSVSQLAGKRSRQDTQAELLSPILETAQNIQADLQRYSMSTAILHTAT